MLSKMKEVFKTMLKNSSTITVNGKTFKGSNSVTVMNYNNSSTVIVDGEIVSTESGQELNISIDGDCLDVKSTNGNITVNGNAQDIITTNGDINVTGTSNNIQTVNGDVRARTVQGKINTVNGDVNV